MASIPDLQPACYVFDTSALIQIERSIGLLRLPDYPGKWLVVPSKVAKQVNSEGAPRETKRWLNKGKLATFSINGERELYMQILVEEKALEDPDVQGIVIAHHRKGTYVVEEEAATRVARRLGVRTIKAKQFLQEVMPRFPGFG